MTTLACLGDVMLARGVSETLPGRDPAEPWGDTLTALRAADLRLANLECAVSDRGRMADPPPVFPFRADPLAIDVLRAAGIDVVTLANNHSLDYGEEALLDTIARLDAAGIAHAGVGRTPKEARAPALVEAPEGTIVGVVGFTDNVPAYAATDERAGTFHVEIEQAGLPPVAEAVAEARSAGADVVVATAHWGPNMRRHPPEGFRAFARAAIEAGADLWFGHSAHVFQGVEIVGGRPIVYDGGDFLDDYAVDPVLRNDRSLLWLATFERGEVALAALPVRLSYARTGLARDDDVAWIERTLSGLCTEMGTAVRRDGEVLRIEPTAGGVGSRR